MAIHTIDLQFQGQRNTIAAFLVETADGPCLVETGPHATLPALMAGIQALGYQPEDVRHVLLTHIHLDHAGAAWAFAAQGATVYVHPEGYRHLLAPSKLLQSAKMIYREQMEALWGSLEPIPDSQLQTVAHGEAVHIGDKTFTAWHTPGHAVHHIAWQLDDSLFTGDVAGIRIHDGLVAPPCPPPDISIEHWQASLALIRALPLRQLYLTHFGRVSDKLPHLDELESRLLAWANWIRPHYEAGTPAEEIVPLFVKLVADELVASGLSESDILAYEHANPAWMSVAGLLRYWKKKNTPQ